MLSRSMPLPVLYEKIFDLIDGIISSSRILIIETDPDAGGHGVMASRVHDKAPDESLKISQAMLHDILEEGRAFLTSDAVADVGTDSVKGMGVHAAIGVPLFDNDRILGAIYLDSRRSNLTYKKEDLQLLTILANQVAVKITHSRLEKDEEKLAKFLIELATAARIQRNLLPKVIPDVEGHQIFAHLDPCEEIGGDMYDVRTCSDGRLWLVVGDVTGHGIAAAMLMSHVMAGLRHDVRRAPRSCIRPAGVCKCRSPFSLPARQG
jgi:hypothetical protein